MQGRKPTPAALRLVTGNPGHRPVPESIGIPISVPEAPAHLSPAAKAEWERVAPKLEVAGLVTELDRVALAMWCDAWGDYVHAREMLAKPKEDGGGQMVTTPNGYEVLSPWATVMRQAYERLMKVGVEFGFTPSARARVEGARQPGLFDGDPMEGFLSAAPQAR